MKLTIKIKLKSEFLKLQQHGDWIDLKVAKTTIIQPMDKAMIDLGVAMKLPKGYEAYLLPRSSTFKNSEIIETNSMGVIDSDYCGNNDVWKFPAFSLSDKPVKIREGERIAQFRIQLTQGASVMTKLKWLFTSGIKIVYVEDLASKDRGGFGSSGK